MQINKDKKKDIILSFFLLMLSAFCSQTLCYYYFDDFLRFYATSLITFIMVRIVFTFFIYLFIEFVIKQKFEKNRQLLLFLTYILLLLTLTMKPVYISSYNMIPFVFIADIQQYQNQIWLLLGNVVLYIPIGIFLPLFTKKEKKLKLFLIVLCVIITIEALQFFFKLGIFDIDDVLLNYAGFSIGYLIYVLYSTVKKRHSINKT